MLNDPKKIIWIAAVVFSLTLAAAAITSGQDLNRTIDWKDLSQIRAAYADAFGEHLTPASSEEEQKRADSGGSERFGPGTRYLGFSFASGRIYVTVLTESVGKVICASLDLELVLANEKDQILTCGITPGKQA